MLNIYLILVTFIFLCPLKIQCGLQIDVVGHGEFVQNVERHGIDLHNTNVGVKGGMSLKLISENLKNTLASVKKSCGEICDQSIKGQPGKYFDSIKKQVNCDALFNNPDIDDPSQFKKPPRKIPDWLLKDFSYSGKVQIKYEGPLTSTNTVSTYYDDSKGTYHTSHWNETVFSWVEKSLDDPENRGPYGTKWTDMIDDFMKNHIDLKDKTVLIVGSSFPWLEVLALRNGAKKVLSVDYFQIKSDHPQIETMPVMELNKRFLDKSLPQLDVMISYSSLEHSGLGRYVMYELIWVVS